MSSFAAGYLSSVRETSPPGRSTDDQPPGIKRFIDALGIEWSTAFRTTIAIVGGIALGIVASLLAYQLDSKPA